MFVLILTVTAGTIPRQCSVQTGLKTSIFVELLLLLFVSVLIHNTAVQNAELGYSISTAPFGVF